MQLTWLSALTVAFFLQSPCEGKKCSHVSHLVMVEMPAPVYLDERQCALVTMSAHSYYKEGVRGEAEIRTNPGFRIVCSFYSFNLATHGQLNATDGDGGPIASFGSGNTIPAPLSSPTPRLHLSVFGGDAADKGISLRCLVEMSPCGLCTDARVNQVILDPNKQPSVSLNSPAVNESVSGMPPGCRCRYALSSQVRLQEKLWQPVPGTQAAFSNQCGQVLTLTINGSVQELAINIDILSSQRGGERFQLDASYIDPAPPSLCPTSSPVSPTGTISEGAPSRTTTNSGTGTSTISSANPISTKASPGYWEIGFAVVAAALVVALIVITVLCCCFTPWRGKHVTPPNSPPPRARSLSSTGTPSSLIREGALELGPIPPPQVLVNE